MISSTPLQECPCRINTSLNIGTSTDRYLNVVNRLLNCRQIVGEIDVGSRLILIANNRNLILTVSFFPQNNPGKFIRSRLGGRQAAAVIHRRRTINDQYRIRRLRLGCCNAIRGRYSQCDLKGVLCYFFCFLSESNQSIRRRICYLSSNDTSSRWWLCCERRNRQQRQHHAEDHEC